MASFRCEPGFRVVSVDGGGSCYWGVFGERSVWIERTRDPRGGSSLDVTVAPRDGTTVVGGLVPRPLLDEQWARGVGLLERVGPGDVGGHGGVGPSGVPKVLVAFLGHCVAVAGCGSLPRGEARRATQDRTGGQRCSESSGRVVGWPRTAGCGVRRLHMHHTSGTGNRECERDRRYQGVDATREGSRLDRGGAR